MTEEVKPVPVQAHRQAVIVQGNPARGLMGAAEAALALGVLQTNLRDQSNLPKPFQTLACGSIWLADDIIKYRDHKRLHPPKPGPKPGWKQRKREAQQARAVLPA